MKTTTEKIKVTYLGGESRENGKSCDYLLAEVKDQDGDLVELYAEVEYPEEALPKDDFDQSWQDYEEEVYIDLYKKFMSKAKELGYSEDDFDIPGGYDIPNEGDE